MCLMLSLLAEKRGAGLKDHNWNLHYPDLLSQVLKLGSNILGERFYRI